MPKGGHKMKINTTNVTRKNVVIEASADVFIVPNSAFKLNPNYVTEMRRIIDISNVMRANNLVYDYDKDDIIQLWFTSKEELKSENLGDHGFRFKTEDGDEFSIFPCDAKIVEMLPRKMFAGLREGESRTIFIPMKDCTAYNRITDKDEKIDIDLRITVTAAQTKYRYKRFGNFEDTFCSV